jgi:hypothetical protein
VRSDERFVWNVDGTMGYRTFRPLRKVWVIIREGGWIWDGIHPWVKSSQPNREAGVTFPTQKAALAAKSELKRIMGVHSARLTVQSA